MDPEARTLLKVDMEDAVEADRFPDAHGRRGRAAARLHREEREVREKSGYLTQSTLTAVRRGRAATDLSKMDSSHLSHTDIVRSCVSIRVGYISKG